MEWPVDGVLDQPGRGGCYQCPCIGSIDNQSVQYPYMPPIACHSLVNEMEEKTCSETGDICFSTETVMDGDKVVCEQCRDCIKEGCFYSSNKTSGSTSGFTNYDDWLQKDKFDFYCPGGDQVSSADSFKKMAKCQNECAKDVISTNIVGHNPTDAAA